MAELLYPNKMELSGPWLIDYKALEELNTIIEEWWERLMEFRESRILEAVERELLEVDSDQRTSSRTRIEERIRTSYEYRKETKRISIIFRSDKELKTHSILEALNEKKIKDEIPTTLETKLVCGEIEMDLSIGRYNHKMTFSVTPASSQIASEFFVKLERWARSCSPPKWQAVWKEWAGFHWFIFFMIIMIALAIIPKKSVLYQFSLKPEAHKILEDGINQKEMSKAIEILLSYETDFYPKDYKTKNEKYVLQIFAFVSVLLVLSIVLSFPPKIHIGLGKGENKVRIWKGWMKLLSITIPGLIITGIILPLILEKIKIFL